MPTPSKKINDRKENCVARHHGGLQDELSSFSIDAGDADRIKAAHGHVYGHDVFAENANVRAWLITLEFSSIVLNKIQSSV